MPFRLPAAGTKYDKKNENDARRSVESIIADLLARLQTAEAALAAGITPPDPVGPSAAFTSAKTNLVVTFTDTSTAGSSAIVSWAWTFGDTATSTLQNPIHTYPDTGTYSVQLTVTDSNGLTSSVTHAVTVSKPVTLGAPAFHIRGIANVADLTRWPWWNAGQVEAMNPGNCVSIIDGFANAGKKLSVRLYQDAGSKDASGVFQVPLWKNSIKRYADAGLVNYLNGRASDGTILFHDIIDDITSGGRWGRVITKAEVEEMAAYSRSLYFAVPAYCRARFTQLTGFNYTKLQGCTSIYLFGRGGVAKGSMTNQQWRIADVTAYKATEQAARNSLNIPLVSGFGLNIINGGDTTSGIPGDGSPPNLFKMSAQEITDYMTVLVPGSERTFQMWEVANDGSSDSYLARTDITAAMNAGLVLCNAQ